MKTSGPETEDARTWVYAFVILLLVSAWMLSLRLMNTPFLALDFEVSLVYLPTILAGLVTLALARRRTRS